MKDFESLVKMFMGNSFERHEVLNQAISLRNTYTEDSADIYVKIMQNVLKDGTEYLAVELNRIERLMQAAIHPDKADELQKRKNILNEFAGLHHARDEL